MLGQYPEPSSNLHLLIFDLHTSSPQGVLVFFFCTCRFRNNVFIRHNSSIFSYNLLRDVTSKSRCFRCIFRGSEIGSYGNGSINNFLLKSIRNRSKTFHKLPTCPHAASCLDAYGTRAQVANFSYVHQTRHLLIANFLTYGNYPAQANYLNC